MKKLTYLTLIVSLFSFKLAIAAPEATNEKPLVPAASLEEMVNAGVDEDTNSFEHQRGAVCFARNGRGNRFVAKGFYPEETQHRAMEECRHVSLRCFELGCHRDY